MEVEFSEVFFFKISLYGTNAVCVSIEPINYTQCTHSDGGAIM